jgi:hypothetical protein
MSKLRLDFNLPEEKIDAMSALYGHDFRCILWAIDEVIVDWINHQDRGWTAEKCMETIRELMKDMPGEDD